MLFRSRPILLSLTPLKISGPGSNVSYVKSSLTHPPLTSLFIPLFNCVDYIINVHDLMPVLLTDDEVTPWLHDTGMASAKLTALQPALESGAAI